MAGGLGAIPRARPPLRWPVITLRAARIWPHALNQSISTSSLPSLEIALGGQALAGSCLGAGGGSSSGAGGPRLTTIRVSLAGSVSMARVPPTRSWLMRVPSVPGEVSRVLRRPSPAARLPGGCPGGGKGTGMGQWGPMLGGHPPTGWDQPPPPARQLLLRCYEFREGLSPDEQHQCNDGDAGRGFSGQGWLQGAGMGDRHPRPGEESCDGGGKGGKTPTTPPAQLQGTEEREAPGMGKMQLQQRGTSVAVYSMSPAIGPLLRAGMGSGCWGRLRAFISKRNVSLVPSCRPSPCPAPAPGSEQSPETQRRTGKGGGMKKPFGTKSAEIHEISWQLGTGGGGADGTRSPTGRDRARTSVPSERDSKNTRRGRGLLLLPLREDSCLHPWGDGANCCLTSSWSPPELSHGAGFCSQFLQEGKLRQGGEQGRAGRSRQPAGCTPLPTDGEGALWVGGSHSPSLGALGGPEPLAAAGRSEVPWGAEPVPLPGL